MASPFRNARSLATQSWSLAGSLAWPLAAAALSSACGSGTKASGFGADAGLPGKDATVDAAHATDGHGGAKHDAPTTLKMTDTGGPTSCSGTHCSSDLRSMLDCNGDVVSTCAANEGCFGTTCEPACQAAIDNKTNIGCEYYVVTPDVIKGAANFGGAAGACFAAFVANTWDTPVTLSADYAGMTLDVSTFAYIATGTGQSIAYAPLGSNMLQAGQVAILFLNRDVNGSPTDEPFLSYDCPTGVTPAITATDTAIHGTGIGSAFHITTDAPVVAYDMYPYGGGHTAVPSATLLLPTSAWDTNYVAVDAYRANTEAYGSQPWVDFVAMKDGTTITLNPTSDINAAPGVAAATMGVPVTYTLNAGQFLELATGKTGINIKLPGELTGSVVQSSDPIGVWAGISGLNVIPTVRATDSGHQQIPPVSSLGSTYVAVRYRNRYPDDPDETPPWRFVGAVDGTTLTYDPAPPDGAPSTLSLGQVVEFDAAGPFVVSSQDAKHPFYAAAYMTGAGPFDPGEDDAGSPKAHDGRGDPEFVNIIPPDEFLQSYIFFADPTYPETNLVIVRVKGPNGFEDVALDCAGDLSGWEPVGSGGMFEYTRFDLSTGDFVPNGSCNNGRHQIKSHGSFGVTVWGWGSAATGDETTGLYTQYASYAYPAGASVAPINTVTVMVPPAPK